jgi:hypothetical protein
VALLGGGGDDSAENENAASAAGASAADDDSKYLLFDAACRLSLLQQIGRGRSSGHSSLGDRGGAVSSLGTRRLSLGVPIINCNA